MMGKTTTQPKYQIMQRINFP